MFWVPLGENPIAIALTDEGAILRARQPTPTLQLGQAEAWKLAGKATGHQSNAVVSISRMATHPEEDILSKIHLSGIHVELTAAMQNLMREKFAVLLRHNGWIVRINVRLHQDQTRGQKRYYTATGQIEVRGPDIVATVKGEDAYNVLDGLVEKLDQQLRDRHERRKDKRNHPHGIEIDATLPKIQPE